MDGKSKSSTAADHRATERRSQQRERLSRAGDSCGHVAARIPFADYAQSRRPIVAAHHLRHSGSTLRSSSAGSADDR